MENPIKMDDLGYLYFRKHPYIYIYIDIYPLHNSFYPEPGGHQKNVFFLVMFFQGLPTSGVYSSIKNSAKWPTFLNFWGLHI